MTFSYTQVSQYLRCPRSYRYRYLDGFLMPDAVANTRTRIDAAFRLGSSGVGWDAPPAHARSLDPDGILKKNSSTYK